MYQGTFLGLVIEFGLGLWFIAKISVLTILAGILVIHNPLLFFVVGWFLAYAVAEYLDKV